MKLAVAMGLGLLCITCTVPDIDELEAESPSGCDADHPCQVRVLLKYEGFRPGCVTLRLADAEDGANTRELPVEPPVLEAQGTREVGFIHRAGWSSRVVVTASARERSCAGQQVASAVAEVNVPEEGTTDVTVDLRARDGDGDGYVSTASGGTDCDDGAPAIAAGLEERCDWLDNNCDGREDPAPVCDGYDWRTTPRIEVATFQDVAPHARGRAWFVSDTHNVLAYVRRDLDGGGVQTAQFTDCRGAWSTAWARPSDGRVFVGSREGSLATRTPAVGEPCEVASFDGGGVPIRDIVGFEQDGGTTLYAVNEVGDILRWEYPRAPMRVAHVEASLRSIHGVDPRTLIAVGSSLSEVPVAYHPDADGGTWLEEPLPPRAEGQFALHSVHVVSPSLAYAVGDRGLLLEREGSTWSRKPPYPVFVDGGVSPDILDVVAFGRSAVLARLATDDITRFDGEQWGDLVFGTQVFTTLEALYPDEPWSAAMDGTGFYWGP